MGDVLLSLTFLRGNNWTVQLAQEQDREGIRTNLGMSSIWDVGFHSTERMLAYPDWVLQCFSMDTKIDHALSLQIASFVNRHMR